MERHVERLDERSESDLSSSGHWQTSGGEVSLIGSFCPSCKKSAFPMRTFCDACGNESGMDRVPLSRKGILYTFTKVHLAPPGFPTPYLLGFIDLPENVRVLAQIDSADGLEIGDELEVVVGPIRRESDGSDVLSYRFRRTEVS